MAGRSFTLPQLKLTRRPAFSKPIRENLHQGARDIQPSLDLCHSGGVTSSEFPSDVDTSSVLESPVSANLESGPCSDNDNELTMHEIESKSSMAGWEAIRSSLLVAVTESKGMPIGQMCVLCGENDSLMKCQQCGPQSYFCQNCISIHSRITLLHGVELWTVR